MMKKTCYILISVLLPLSGCGRFFYYPDNFYYFPPDKNGYKAEDVFFPSRDGTVLHGWFIPSTAANPKGTIVQFHGNAQNISAHYASLVWLTRRGYNLFTFDYRGYGRSEGNPDQEGTYKDALAALALAWGRHEKSRGRSAGSQFIIYAQSLGGTIALRAFADFLQRDRTTLLVIDSSFPSYKDIAAQKLASFWLTWLLSPLGYVLVSDSYAPENYIPKLSFPGRLLVIHDKQDQVVGFKNGKEIYELARGIPAERKEFWELDAGRHASIFAIDTLENRERFVAYLEKLRSSGLKVEKNP